MLLSPPSMSVCFYAFGGVCPRPVLSGAQTTSLPSLASALELCFEVSARETSARFYSGGKNDQQHKKSVFSVKLFPLPSPRQHRMCPEHLPRAGSPQPWRGTFSLIKSACSGHAEFTAGAEDLHVLLKAVSNHVFSRVWIFGFGLKLFRQDFRGLFIHTMFSFPNAACLNQKPRVSMWVI